MPTTSIKEISAADYCEQAAYEEAANVLEGWRGVGVRPFRGRQTDAEYAITLQWAAVISVGLGLKRQLRIGDAARDMLTESHRISGSAEPLVWLGICYYRCGEYSEADAILRSSLDYDLAPRVRFLALLNLAVVATHRCNYEEAISLLEGAEPLLPLVRMLGRGKFYLQRGLICRKRGQLDAAIIAYENAEDCFDQAKNRSYEAAACVNMARAFLEQGNHLKAHVRAQRAVSLTKAVGDKLHCAKGWDEIARIYLAEGKLDNAERASRQAIGLVEGGEQEQVLAECLITHGIILGRLGFANSTTALTRAAEICTRIGDHSQLSQANTELMRTVKACRQMVSNINETIRPIERQLIKDALGRNHGMVARAAKELDMHINTLNKKIKEQFPDLLEDRRPVFKRRKGIMK